MPFSVQHQRPIIESKKPPVPRPSVALSQNSEIAFASKSLASAPWSTLSGSTRMAGLGARITLGLLTGNTTMVEDAYAAIWGQLTVQAGVRVWRGGSRGEGTQGMHAQVRNQCLQEPPSITEPPVAGSLIVG
jgi:hypothetical protein